MMAPLQLQQPAPRAEEWQSAAPPSSCTGGILDTARRREPTLHGFLPPGGGEDGVDAAAAPELQLPSQIWQTCLGWPYARRARCRPACARVNCRLLARSVRLR